MNRTLAWMLVLVVVMAVGIQVLCEGAKPVPVEQLIPTLETVLRQLAVEARQAIPQAERFASALGMDWKADCVRVVVETNGAVPSDEISQLGGRIVARADALNMLEVEIPAVGLLELARLSGVAFVRRPYRPVPTAISEGVQVSGAGDWQQAGYSGQGIRVAVIDSQFGGLSQAIASGEVAHVIFSRDYTGEGLETGGVHGAACTEIVHDMAPQAELLLMKIGNEVELADAVDDAIAYGANVVTCSLGWFNTNFYDGTGVVADIVYRAAQSGILWVNAGGNSADGGHWEGGWQDADGDEWLDFAPVDEVNSFYLGAGQSVALYLTWDAWPQTDQDYDLYLVDGWGHTVASSENWQTGTQEPTESIFYTVAVGGNYGIRIHAHDASMHPKMELFCVPYSLPLEYSLAASSVAAPANAPFVFTVGAIDWHNWDSGPQEAFSSQGPTNSSRYSASITKPDICGPDGTTSSVYQGAFYGTSASTPHVAGAAALVWSAHQNWSAANVRDWLESNAVDMGALGKDNIYGYGRLNLPLGIGTDLCRQLNPGWNLISLPLDPDDPDARAVFDEIIGPLYLCTYNTEAETFDWVDKPPSATVGAAGTLSEAGPLRGYWIAVSEGANICVSGTQLRGDQSTELQTAGWHMIGVPYAVAWGNGSDGSISVRRGIQIKSLIDAVAAGWVHDTIWQWDTVGEEWITRTASAGTTLYPWIGYWINTSVDDLVFQFSETPGLQGFSSQLMPMDGVPLVDPPMPWGAALGLTSVKVVNEPNPVTDGYSTTFQVRGICPCSVRGLRVDVYDFAGRLMWHGECSAGFLPWHPQDASGESLANGVYLYRAQVKIGDRWGSVPIGKLAILR